MGMKAYGSGYLAEPIQSISLDDAGLAQAASKAQVSPEQLRRAILTGGVGSALEYYDFAIFGLATALVFRHIFFPTLGANAGLLASFGTYGAGFLARPFGGLFFGSLGDRKGRKFVLLLTIAIMGVSTMLIGLLPTGPGGAIVLVALRLVQGFGAGAEQAGASTLMAEVSPVPRRGFFAALPFVGIFAGFGLATATFSVMQHTLGNDEILAWAWRVPFLASVVLIGVAVWIRLRLRESPVFLNLEGAREVVRSPMKAVMTSARRPVLAAVSWWMVSTGNSLWIALAMFGGLAIGANSMLGAQCAHFAELFGNRCRYSGVALAREIGAVLSGGLAPVLGVYLVALAGGAYWVMGVYTAVLASLTLIGVALSTETRGRDLTELNDAIH